MSLQKKSSAGFRRLSASYGPSRRDLSFRKSPCIRPHCSLCESGQGDSSYALYGKKGKPRFSIYVPEELAPDVKRAIRNGRNLQQLIAEAGRRYTVSFRKLALLHVASKYGHVEIVALLLRYGADANARADGGVTPLHLAARNGHTKVTELLLAAHADLNAMEDFHQSTPLGWAEFHGHAEVVAFLRQRGAQS